MLTQKINITRFVFLGLLFIGFIAPVHNAQAWCTSPNSGSFTIPPSCGTIETRVDSGVMSVINSTTNPKLKPGQDIFVAGLACSPLCNSANSSVGAFNLTSTIGTDTRTLFSGYNNGGAGAVLSGSTHYPAPSARGNYSIGYKAWLSGKPSLVAQYSIPFSVEAGTLEIKPNVANAPWTLSGCKSQTGVGSTTILNVPAGICTVVWGAVVGYTKPSFTSGTLFDGRTLSLTGTYASAGTATITIRPTLKGGAGVFANAMWTLDMCVPVVSGMGYGTQTVPASELCRVVWGDVSHSVQDYMYYNKPTPNYLSGYTGAGLSREFTGEYVRQSGVIIVNPQLNGVSSATAPWTLSGCKIQSGNGLTTISDIPTPYTAPGQCCKVTWGAVSGYVTPAPNVIGMCLPRYNTTDTITGNYITGPALPDLTATTVYPDVVTAVADYWSIGASVGMNGTITSQFPYFFQIASGVNGTGTIVDLPSAVTQKIGAFYTPDISTKFPYGTSGYYSMRICVDKTDRNGGGVVIESNEDNNCTNFQNITATACGVANGKTYPSVSDIPIADMCTLTQTPDGQNLIMSPHANTNGNYQWLCGKNTQSWSCHADISPSGGTCSAPTPYWDALSNKCYAAGWTDWVTTSTCSTTCGVTSTKTETRQCVPTGNTCTPNPDGTIKVTGCPVIPCTPTGGAVCGNTKCEVGESPASCPKDCKPKVQQF